MLRVHDIRTEQMYINHMSLINGTVNQRDNQQWTIQRNWQHYKTHDEEKQNTKHSTEN